MITAKNYAAQVKRAADTQAAALKEKKHEYWLLVAAMAEGIGKAQHFALPDGGLIFDDDKKGLWGLEIRLPYPDITIEWHSDEGKHLVYAFEQEKGDDVGILVMSAMNLDGEWVFIRQIACLTGQVDSEGYSFKLHKHDGSPIYSPTEIEQGGAAYVIDIVLELCEALSCTNVTHEPIEKINPSVNARRVRDGKLPLYETHRLIINAGKTSGSHGVSGSSHASPRQHLRRGHIRRLPSGNIWVNSCVVGSAELGVVKKEYAIRRAA